MNAGENISKIGSICIILCFAALALLFTLLGGRLGLALPVHAQALTPVISISPTSGPAGTTVNVSGSGIVDNSTGALLASGAVTYGYSSSSDSSCSSASYVGSGSNTTWPTAGSFTGSFAWPSGVSAGTYIVCVSISKMEYSSSLLVSE